MSLLRHKQQPQQAYTQYTIPAVFQRDAQTAYQAFWIRTGTFTFPFAALTISCASCCEISAVDKVLQIMYKKHTYNPQTRKPSASPVLEMMNQTSENPNYSPVLSSNILCAAEGKHCPLQDTARLSEEWKYRDITPRRSHRSSAEDLKRIFSQVCRQGSGQRSLTFKCHLDKQIKTVVCWRPRRTTSVTGFL